MGRIAAGTIVNKNYMSFARALARSLGQHHPDVPFHVALADEVEGHFVPEAEPFHHLGLADLGIPDLRRLLFRYPARQVAIAAKPYLLSRLLEGGFDGAIFLDADILVLSDLTEVLRKLDNHSIVLIPHLLQPLEGEARVRRELNILQAGVFNGGFLGVSNTPAAHEFLSWWQRRVYEHCRPAVDQGMHYDQRWLDLVPGFFDGVHVLRDPGCNVAYWNLGERDVRVAGGAVLAGDQPCRFFHFSGFTPDRPLFVSRYAPALTMADIGPAAGIFRRYCALLQAEGYRDSSAWPYAYGHFDNAVPIPDLVRDIYAELGEAADGFGDPFETAPQGSYFHWLTGPAEGSDTSDLPTRLWRKVYERRPDLQAAFPDPAGADRERFRIWAAQRGTIEHAIPPGLAAFEPSRSL